MLFFFLFQCFEGKGYQMESKRNGTFGNVIFGTNMIQRTWSLRKAINEESTRQGARPPPPGVPCTLVGPSLLHRRTSSSYIYPYTLETSDTEPKPFPPPQPSVLMRSHLVACSGAPPEEGRHHGGLLHHHSLSDEV